jgi:hypothetical protein
MQHPNEDRQHLAGLYRDLLDTDRRGQVILEDLIKRFGRAKVHTDGGIDAVLKTYRTAAHRELLDYILAMINAGNGVEDQGENDVS